MKALPNFDVDHCKYRIPYRERTRLWTNLDTWTPGPLCKRDCAMMGGHMHTETTERARSNGKHTCPENYIHFVQTISTKNMNAMHTARYLRALASCCAFPLTILRLARLDHCVKGIVQWWVALGIKNLHKEHLVIAQTLALKTIYTLFKPLVQNIWMLCILHAICAL